MTALQLQVRHATRYDYAAPVTLAHHLAHLHPLQDAHQQLLQHTLEISPPPGDLREGRDAHGNACTWFSLDQAHPSLEVVATSRLEISARFEALQADASPAWDALAHGLQYVSRSPFDPAVEFALPSPYVPRLPGLRDWAAASLAPGRPVAEAALALMAQLHGEFEYASASTQVDTPLRQAFERRRGVCQDFAHVLIGALRMHGVPARYVSGYLLTQAATGEPAMVGADASHAWVQVHAPGTPGVPADGWLDLDPTNRVVPGAGHVRVAVGRDYGDVAPLRGVIRGGGRHTLGVSVHTRRAA